MIYFIPFSHHYLIDLDISNAKTCKDASLRIVENKKLVRDLGNFVCKLDTNSSLSEHSLDVRVVIAFHIRNERREIGLDAFGKFAYKGKIYPKSNYLINLIEKNNSYIKWE